MDIRSREFPKSICVRITRRCNAACAFCQAPDTSRAELSAEQLEVVAVALATRGVRSLKFSGGEPTVRRDLPRIVRGAAAAGLKPVVITNGMLVRPELLEVCALVGGELKFSVHRPDSGNDEVLRVRSFDRVVGNMRRAIDAGVRVSVNTVVAHQQPAELRAMVDFAYRVGAWKVSFIPVVPRGRAAAHQEFALSEAQVNRVRSEVHALAREFENIVAVRCIDIRKNEYWIIENDGDLWVERATEATDLWVCDTHEILSLAVA